MLMFRAGLEGGAPVEAILKLDNTFLAEVQKTALIEDLSVSRAAMLRRFADCVSTQPPTRHANRVQKAVHLYAKRIDPHTVSEHLHLSAAHFNKIFEEEKEEGFVHSLNQIRVECSKDLLRDHSISLAAITEMVGFEDQSYFT